MFDVQYLLCTNSNWLLQESFLQRPTRNQSAAHKHVAHHDVAASLHESFYSWWVEGAAPRDKAETFQLRAAGQSLEERRGGVQVGLL